MKNFSSLCVLTLLGLAACKNKKEEALPPPPPPIDAQLVGTWRLALDLDGQELPGQLDVVRLDDGKLDAWFVNGPERLHVPAIEVSGRTVRFHDPITRGEMRVELAADGSSFAGKWRAAPLTHKKYFEITGQRGKLERFGPLSGPPLCGKKPASTKHPVAGRWRGELHESDGQDSIAELELTQDGAKAQGTFVSIYGDTRAMPGAHDAGVVRLSSIGLDRALLVRACMRDDGTMTLDFSTSYNMSAWWEGERATDAPLPSTWTSFEARKAKPIQLSLPDIKGNTVSLADPQFAGKVVLLDIFGTWCTTCKDLNPVLLEWEKKYAARGLSIVIVAHEFSGDPERDRKALAAYAERYELPFPVLLGDSSLAPNAQRGVRGIGAIGFYPTLALVDRAKRLRKFNTRYVGPAAGRHVELVREYEKAIEELLAEK